MLTIDFNLKMLFILCRVYFTILEGSAIFGFEDDPITLKFFGSWPDIFFK
jgi:hypothetical protein